MKNENADEKANANAHVYLFFFPPTHCNTVYTAPNVYLFFFLPAHCNTVYTATNVYLFFFPPALWLFSSPGAAASADGNIQKSACC